MSKPNPPLMMQRRRWLQLAGGTLASALGTAGLSGLMLAPRSAYAADYKALVCLFLYGGNDGMNTVVPTDATRHGQYSSVRGALALPRSSLVGLGGTDYGLHPSLSALAGAWSDGALAPVFNVGPLYRPITKAEYRAADASSSLVPDSLFSHSDQQALWEAASTDALTRTGWGGRAAEVLNTTNPVISLGSGGGRFGLSSLNAALGLPDPGQNFGVDGHTAADLGWAPVAARKAALDTLYAQAQDNVMLEAYAQQQREAFATSQRLAPIVQAQPGSAAASALIDQAFAPLIVNGQLSTPLAKQLYQIAKLIANNATVQGNRQIFFASQGGFDTHGNQIAYGNALQGTHAGLLKQLGDACAAFHQAMKNLGMGPQVTLFTQSDFGRTFKPNNSSGTDHAWGNHQIVLGGAVKGGATYGTYPTLALGGPDDVGVDSWELQGRWIPTTSVDQYAATLLRWFGADDGQLGAILPNLGNFSQRTLGFL